uniref:Lipase domain-containing protein n=1 Tax=Glossina austeni TaxID=7395 RepID=A0A1A9VIC5_GLOAU
MQSLNSLLRHTDNTNWLFLTVSIALWIPTTTNARPHFITSHNTPQELLPTSSNSNSIQNASVPVVSKPSITMADPPLGRDISIGPCIWTVDRKCPDRDILFYLYTRKNPKDRQFVHIDESLKKSNLTSSHFNKLHPTKIIIHGYNSDMFLHPLQLMKDDWSKLSLSPCYMSAVYNTRHTGACVAKLVERILDTGASDIHVIGFSLGAQLTNYIARNLGSFLLPRITGIVKLFHPLGLDPAMPLFITASAAHKLDPSDAAYVDVIHTNAIVQGKLERCGHADFYMNGGIMQPGCYNSTMNAFACSHQRAPAYYLESIRSPQGFWGWPCSSYLTYILGMCPPNDYLVEAGEHVKPSTRGLFIIKTKEAFPFALGKGVDVLSLKDWWKKNKSTNESNIKFEIPSQKVEPLQKFIDQWGKLDSTFNNLQEHETESPYDFMWTHVDDSNIADKPSVSIEEEDIKDLNKSPTHEKQLKINLDEYRENLTSGFIDSSIFSVPILTSALEFHHTDGIL